MITRLFLHGKAWQIFLASIFVSLILLYFAFSKVMPAKIQVVLIMLISSFPLLWFYILGVNLHSKLSEPSSMNIKLFKLNLFFTFLCLLTFKYLLKNHELFLFLYINSSFFYMFYFLSKSLVSVEKGKLIGFYDYIGVFFYIWLLPYGIWWLQPRIRKIFNEDFA